jgi:hypothetical protein
MVINVFMKFIKLDKFIKFIKPNKTLMKGKINVKNENINGKKLN